MDLLITFDPAKSCSPSKYFAAFCRVIDQMKRRQHKFQNQLDAVYSLHRIYDDYDTLVEAQSIL